MAAFLQVIKKDFITFRIILARGEKKIRIFKCQIHDSIGNKQVKYRILLLISLSYCLLANLCLCTSWAVNRNWFSSQMNHMLLFHVWPTTWDGNEDVFGVILRDITLRLKLGAGDLRPTLTVHWSCRKELVVLFGVRWWDGMVLSWL